MKSEVQIYKKYTNILAKEELIYQKSSDITNELVTVKDVEKSFKEVDK